MTYLLDISTLLAWLWKNHVAHDRVLAWEKGIAVAVCPLAELGFLRISTQPAFGASMDDARKMLTDFMAVRTPQFVPCDVTALSGTPATASGKVTDCYLANLAGGRGMMLATLDSGIGHPAAFVVPELSDSMRSV
jgi:predicted nucleic acid-binding protein